MVQAKIPSVEGIEIFSGTRKFCFLIFYYFLLVNLPSKFTSVFHVCPVIDRKFHHDIVKVAVDLQDDIRLDSHATLTMYTMKFIVNDRTDA